MLIENTHPKCFIAGYSGHGYVALDILLMMGKKVIGYLEVEEKSFDPYLIPYLGKETSIDSYDPNNPVHGFIAIGEGRIREKIFKVLTEKNYPICNAIHPSSVISNRAEIGNGVMVAANTVVNPLAKINDAVICNTGTVVEHECIIGAFTHIAPGAVLCGNVTVGSHCFIGANSVIRQGISIGNNVIIGAGSVIVKDIPDNTKVVGNPQRIINTR